MIGGMRRWLGVVLVAACGPRVGSDDGGSSSGASSSEATDASIGPSSGSATSGIDPSSSTSSSGTASTDATDEVGSTSPVPDVATCPAPDCDGVTYHCSDGDDNDGDGLIDFADPECFSICDDDEAVLPSNLPLGHKMFDGCRVECAFDGNTGQGDDGCINDLRCDPEDPGIFVGCEYQDNSANCDDWPQPLSDDCSSFCEPLVLPGCDCFGCCTVATDDGPIDILIEAGYECSLTNLDACPRCTSRIDECGNACDVCEICFGQSDSGSCEVNVCDRGDPCSSHEDCACGELCQLGCCLPLPPG
jgi:hypothetical protein